MTKRPAQSLRKRVRQYLVHRRACGFKLRTDGYVLKAFAGFADRTAPGSPVTTALALRWISRSPHLRAVTRANRLNTIRCFSRFCRVFDPRTEVPASGLSSRLSRRQVPYIVTPSEVRLIMRRAGALRANGSTLRPQTIQTLIGLIACTGLRIGEALRLQCDDLDARAGTLHIERAKFSPERDLPLHSSTVRALDSYRRIRRRHYPDTRHLFIGPHGRPLQLCAAQWTLRQLVLDFAPRGGRQRPRYHDLRHSLATRLIARWARAGAPVEHRLVLLSRYLGHKHFHNTYWYVEPQRRALNTASVRFERSRAMPEDPS